MAVIALTTAEHAKDPAIFAIAVSVEIVPMFLGEIRNIAVYAPFVDPVNNNPAIINNQRRTSNNYLLKTKK